MVGAMLSPGAGALHRFPCDITIHQCIRYKVCIYASKLRIGNSPKGLFCCCCSIMLTFT